MSKEQRIRHHLSLPKHLSDRLEALTREPGVTKSNIVAEALSAWLKRRGADELELRFAERLNRISRQLGRIERNGHIELESLALFVRYMLTINAPLPEGDAAGRAIGRDRFAAFVQRVGEQVAKGRVTFLGDEQE